MRRADRRERRAVSRRAVSLIRSRCERERIGGGRKTFNALANASAPDDDAPRMPRSGGSEPRDMNRAACRSTRDAWSIRTKRRTMLDPRGRGARCIG
ncbi:hypothetical protein WS62_20180 [Burkholderia sp. ABCPW 14]|nr:hypothetical protein WS62_20180 [Burkholderia sp. ABCPW 14]